mmetsp:Transcript_63397/g.94065  ORF Transcript_63397/g.94065 Transcript_63397/m.94065 type:complete len:91 (-) Transcript_63397:94-366(-)
MPNTHSQDRLTTCTLFVKQIIVERGIVLLFAESQTPFPPLSLQSIPLPHIAFGGRTTLMMTAMTKPGGYSLSNAYTPIIRIAFDLSREAR